MASEIGKIVTAKSVEHLSKHAGIAFIALYAITRTAAMQPSAVTHGPKWSGNRRNVRKQK